MKQPPTMDDNDDHRAQMLQQIKESEERKKRARREKKRSLWFGLGVMGVIGWSIIAPILLGIFIGLWLDRTFTDNIPWTLVLLLLGLLLGVVNAWKWVQKEMASIQKEREEKKRE